MKRISIFLLMLGLSLAFSCDKPEVEPEVCPPGTTEKPDPGKPDDPDPDNPPGPTENPITVLEIGQDYFEFSIDFEGDYVFIPFEEAYLTAYGTTPAVYLASFKIQEYGPQTIRWEDGGTYINNPMTVSPGTKYIIAAAQSDFEGNITGEVFTREFETEAVASTEATVQLTLSEITSTSVRARTEPDGNVSKYYLLIQPKATIDNIIANYGESMVNTLCKGNYAWHLEGTYEEVWGGLNPSTEYYAVINVVDNEGAESLIYETFTTEAPAGAAPQLEITLSKALDEEYKTLVLKIKADNAATVKYAFNTSADVAAEIKNGYDDAGIVNNRGADLTAEQIAEVNASGTEIVLNDLWPGTEYTAIVSAKSAEQMETVQKITLTTSDQPFPVRVESDLFTELLGTWEVSYSYLNANLVEAQITNAVVTIAAGVDDYTNTLYRNQNRLVITGWPFTSQEIPFYTPEELKAESSYYREYPTLAYRDYGPKIFLEIGENDKITVPSAKNTYLYNWTGDGYTMYFYGCDYDDSKMAPASFPVTLSADKKTLTIGEYQSGSEFNYGTYRPSVFRNAEDPWSIATTDIVLKKK